MRDEKGKTALQHALENRYHECAQVLFDHGASIEDLKVCMTVLMCWQEVPSFFPLPKAITLEELLLAVVLLSGFPRLADFNLAFS